VTLLHPEEARRLAGARNRSRSVDQNRVPLKNIVHLPLPALPVPKKSKLEWPVNATFLFRLGASHPPLTIDHGRFIFCFLPHRIQANGSTTVIRFDKCANHKARDKIIDFIFELKLYGEPGADLSLKNLTQKVCVYEPKIGGARVDVNEKDLPIARKDLPIAHLRSVEELRSVSEDRKGILYGYQMICSCLKKVASTKEYFCFVKPEGKPFSLVAMANGAVQLYQLSPDGRRQLLAKYPSFDEAMNPPANTNLSPGQLSKWVKVLQLQVQIRDENFMSKFVFA